MNKFSEQEKEKMKQAIFDSMSPRRQKYIAKKGYAKWDPFQEPKDPIDIRKDSTRRTSQSLIREFLQTRNQEEYSNQYGRGAFDLCLGIINDDDRSRGMFDFSCWYKKILENEKP